MQHNMASVSGITRRIFQMVTLYNINLLDLEININLTSHLPVLLYSSLKMSPCSRPITAILTNTMLKVGQMTTMLTGVSEGLR